MSFATSGVERLSVTSWVLDASALLALLNQEPGKDRVEQVLPDSVVGAVNYCEAVGKLIDAGVPENEARNSVGLLNIEIIDFDENLAFLAASIRPSTRKLGLSLGDRSCLALGLARRATVVTTERNWSKLELGVKVEVIR